MCSSLACRAQPTRFLPLISPHFTRALCKHLPFPDGLQETSALQRTQSPYIKPRIWKDMTLRYIASLVVGLVVLTCKTWAAVDVSMEDRVEVSLKDQAEIPCIYTLQEPALMIVWFTKLPGKDQGRIRICYYDNQTEIIEEGSEYAGRIKVSHSYDPHDARGTAILTIDKVELSDQREFICMVHNVLKESGEGRTRLQVFKSPSMPVIEGTYTGISVTEEKPSKVANCKVDDGYPRPNITWYKDRFPLQPSDGEVKILESQTIKTNGLFALESQLFIKVIREDEDAVFYCEVQYFVPGASRMIESQPINITVFYPTTNLTVYINSSKKLIKEGDTVEIHCEGNGNPQPLLTFIHKGEPAENANNEILTLKDVKRSDSGTYECQLLDLEGYSEDIVESSIDITVHYLDDIVVTPEETDLDQGYDLTLTCNALSSLPTNTTWYKDGMPLEKRHVLELRNASYNTSGMYTCEVMVPSLPELQKQKSVQIIVRGKPEITEWKAVGPMNKADHSVILTCSAQGYPLPNISLSAFDRRTNQTVPVSIVKNQNTEPEPDTVVVSMTGSVKATSELTANCRAYNEFGTVSASRDIEAIARVKTTTQATSTKGGSGVAIAVIIICLLLIAILGSVLYFLYKKGKLPCGRSGKQDFTKEKASKDDIVMEMKSGKSEEAVLLQGVNGDKKSPTE
ncbi:melanoma cell adhesion molecule b isoform X2 [Megalobrama amblycephala]|uniref:melanoma cell adhesion molecule b isoform X2 n=1 Tax=Megalobrama amblycephala TaxID=75352 RepID=UPI002013D761|nr:melanoma cell adhesion molecule b isoform X2 [Megalobrama amblycephala]